MFHRNYISATDQAIEAEISSTVSDEHMAASALSDRNLGQLNFSMFLYDSNDFPPYILGRSDLGYVICHRNSGAFLEGGEGPSPYDARQYMDRSRKYYYGGLFLYYSLDLSTGLFNDLLSDRPSYTIKEHPQLAQVISEHSRLTQPIDVPDLTRNQVDQYAVTAEVKKNVGHDFPLRNYAFGYNGGAYNNSCTAVALQIIMNYFDDYVDNAILPTRLESESMIFDTPSEPINIDKYPQKFPNAFEWHHALVDVYGLKGPAFGYDVVKALANSRLKVNYQMGAHNSYITGQIDVGRPAMITTGVVDAPYAYHSMVVYGYTKYTSGNVDYLVHRGWYYRVIDGIRVSELMNIEGKYYSRLFYVPARYALYSYKFYT